MLVTLSFVACNSKEGTNNNGPQHIVNTDIVGQWHLISWNNQTPEFEVYLDIKEEGTFDIYQQTWSLYYEHFTGLCYLNDNIITGKYSDGKNWGATSGYKAEVTKVGEEATLTLTNVDKPEDVSVYEQCTIPSDVKGATVKMTTRGEEMFEVVRFL